MRRIICVEQSENWAGVQDESHLLSCRKVFFFNAFLGDTRSRIPDADARPSRTAELGRLLCKDFSSEYREGNSPSFGFGAQGLQDVGVSSDCRSPNHESDASIRYASDSTQFELA